jgi:hypothetical protein
MLTPLAGFFLGIMRSPLDLLSCLNYAFSLKASRAYKSAREPQRAY